MKLKFSKLWKENKLLCLSAGIEAFCVASTIEEIIEKSTKTTHLSYWDSLDLTIAYEDLVNSPSGLKFYYNALK